MSDPDRLSSSEADDKVTELPSHNAIEKGHSSSHPHHGQTGPASHVDYDFFDPTGVHALQRTLSRMSQAEPVAETSNQASRESFESDVTLTPGEGPFDFGKALRTVMKKMDDSDIKRRELGVLFKDLRVVGLGSSANFQSTFGSTLSPLNIFHEIHNIRHPTTRNILSDFNGVVRPGEMLLVLGRPGAGCSTLLRVLANQRQEFHSVHGDVHYDSFTPEDIEKHYRGDIQYCPEDDIHLPTLTVRQTLRFAAKTRTPQVRVGGLSREEAIERITTVIATIFGLRHVQDTLVGDASIRGVSGGQKKRVSIAEAMATRNCLNSWDNSTRGLDASTALEFVQALRIATDIARSTTIVSIYQAGEPLYELFDKVCLIYEGQMAYFGPVDRARQYFIDMGFEPANRQTTADFLVAVTDPLGRIQRSGFEGRTPRTAIEFAGYFKQSDFAKLNQEDMDSYQEEFVGKPQRADLYHQSAKSEHARNTSEKSPYIISIPMQIRALVTRRVQVLLGNVAAQVIQTASFVLQAIIIGTVFLRLKDTTATFFSRGGVIYFALLFASLSAMAEIPALFAQRPIVYRQSRAAMYHPFADTLALVLVDIPITFITICVFCVVLYFLVGLQESPGQFFTFLLLVYTMTFTMKSAFRALATAFNQPAPAQAVAGVGVLILTLYTGYTIPETYMIGALRWLRYINPLKYAFEALIVNEFHTINSVCSQLVPQGPGYENVSLANQVCTVAGAQAGQTTVNGDAYVSLNFGYSHSHLWRNFGIICAFCISFICVLLALAEFNTGSVTENAVTLFKRGSNTQIATETADDEEKSYGNDTVKEHPTSPGLHEAKSLTPKNVDIFSWQHLNYVVPVAGGERQLLDDVSGYVAPGKLTALMGESGAGKTTLLNVLAERTSSGIITGDRFVNGQALPADFQAQSGYCQQMDTHLPTTTVREALLFSAKMRQPESVPLAEKEAYVEECLKMCGLEAYADAVVGSLGVEHRKRTTIGVELAAKPGLLIFADEPTSGLDSQSAWAIVSFLRDLADRGQAILCTIHQPSGELFQVFDNLLLLRKGGQTVYFGDLGHNSMTLIKYFERNGAQACGKDENPAEYILSVIGAGATASSTSNWHDIWKASPEAEGLQRDLEKIHSEGRTRPAAATATHSEFMTSWLHQLRELIKRDWLAHWRNPTYIMAKLLLNTAGGLLIGFTFFKSKNSAQGTQDKLFAIFMSTVMSVPLANQLQVPFIAMRNIYEIRERPSRMYSWTALVTSQILVELPWNMLGTILYFMCWYWTVGFPSDRAGYTFLFMCIIFPLYYTTIGQAVAAMSPSAEIAALLFSFLFSFVLTFNGVLQPFSQLGWWQWMYRLSPFTYLLEGLLGQAIGKTNITCSAVEYAVLTPPSGQTCSEYMASYIATAGGYLLDPDASDSCHFCAYRTADEFFGKTFNMSYSHRWRNVGIFCAFLVFNTVAVYAFTYLFRIHTGSYFGWLKKWFVGRKSA